VIKLYLVDTNIWLERLLNQEKSEEVGKFLDNISSGDLYITDFTFHSIGLILCRLNQKKVLLQFIQDVFIDGAVNLVHLEPTDIKYLMKVMDEFVLDFDDAYQYVAAEKYGLTIISFDSDFDRTRRGKKTPIEIL